jgi:GT2 family glycosyltransferase
MAHVSIITINYNGYAETAELLDSLKKHLSGKGYSYEVVVVDNGSSGNDIDLLNAAFPRIKTIHSRKNLGFSGGNNLGIRHSSGDYYLFLNNDTVIDSDIILPLLQRFDENEKIGVVTPKILDFLTKRIIYAGSKPLGKYMIRIHYYTDIESSQKKIPVPYAPGTALLVKREVVEKAGMWPELYFLYEEELDWSLSILKAGYEIWYDSNACIYHKGAMSTGKESPLVHYYTTRNRLLIYKRNLKGWYKFGSIFFTISISIPQRCLKFLLRGQYPLVKATLYGLLDFIKGTFYQRENI